MLASSKCIAFIKQEEGFTCFAIGDVKKQVIGYGHDLLAGESYPHGITEEMAEDLLMEDVHKAEMAVLSHHLPLTQGQFDALVDFTFNLGAGNLIVLLSHGLNNVPRQLPRWDNIAGMPSKPLLARRLGEANFWFKE